MTQQLRIDDDLFQFEPAPEQAKAVELAAEHRVMILTGGPGTGKTATTKAIIALFERNGIRVRCAAPTGKAAIRMTEQTGHEASTIHRLLEYNPGGGFKYDRTVVEQIDETGKWRGGGRTLDTDAVIIDEASMIDTQLFSALLRGINVDKTRLIIVGDVDQLPSIGAGAVLNDLIESSKLPVVRLLKIFRQADESSIPFIARDVNHARAPEFTAADACMVNVDGAWDVLQAVTDAFKNLPVELGVKQDDIQILCAQKTKTFGVEMINKAIQRQVHGTEALEQKGRAMFIGGGYKALEGDRVIHTRNNYNLEVMNGEIGKVVYQDWKGIPDYKLRQLGLPSTAGAKMVVQYTDRKVVYTQGDAGDLLLAYAITIHKSQGSQFKTVIMPVHAEHAFMMTRALVYTGITRAEEHLYIVGQQSQLNKAGGNVRGRNRRTTLQELLTED